MVRIAFLAAALALGAAAAQTPVPQTDTSTVTADGTAHITRVVPLPTDLSPEARAAFAKPGDDKTDLDPDVVRRRAATQKWQDGAGKQSAAVYPVKITESTMGGVPVHVIDPLADAKPGPVSGPGMCSEFTSSSLDYSVIQHAYGAKDQLCFDNGPTQLHADRVLLNLHGGGFDSDSGSLTESVPIANLTRTRVVAALYRLAPEHPYPAAVDDAVAVYRELLKTYKPAHIAVYGTSAGAILTAELAVRLKQLNLPEPGALGIFSGFGDVTHTTDASALYTLTGFTGPLKPPSGEKVLPLYFGSAAPTDPVVSPNLSDLHGLPPTLFITSSRDLLLSATANMERAWRRDGIPTEMTVFDGLAHAFWNDVNLPESREAYAVMARFFVERLGR